MQVILEDFEDIPMVGAETVELTQSERDSISETAVRTVLNTLFHSDHREKDLVVVTSGGEAHQCHASLLALTR